MANNTIDFIIDSLNFDVDNELKKAYFRQKPIDTAKSEYQTFVAVDEYEELLGKSIYNFSFSERDELMMMKFRNTTIGTVVSTISKLKGYIDFCIRQGKVTHMQNIFDTLSKQEAKKFVSKQATEFRFISEDKLIEYQNILENPQDKLLLELPYIGVRGRTTIESTLEEIINLQIKPNSDNVKNCKLELFRNDDTSRIIFVSQKTMDLIVETYKCDEYVTDNGKFNENLRGGIRKFKINRFKDYVFCAIGIKKFDKLNTTVINSRMQRIKKWCDNDFITIYNLYMSGMINMAMKIYNEKGEITKSDYIDICKRFKYGDKNPEKYYLKVKEDVELYLKGSVENA